MCFGCGVPLRGSALWGRHCFVELFWTSLAADWDVDTWRETCVNRTLSQREREMKQTSIAVFQFAGRWALADDCTGRSVFEKLFGNALTHEPTADDVALASALQGHGPYGQIHSRLPSVRWRPRHVAMIAKVLQHVQCGPCVASLHGQVSTRWEQLRVHPSCYRAVHFLWSFSAVHDRVHARFSYLTFEHSIFLWACSQEIFTLTSKHHVQVLS